MAESGRKESKQYYINRFSRVWRMDGLTLYGTAESVSLDQIPRRERVQGNICFPVQLTTTRIGNLTNFIQTLL